MRVACRPWCARRGAPRKARLVRVPKHHRSTTRPNQRMMISDGLPSIAVDQESRP
jgi:hypothetical protein